MNYNHIQLRKFDFCPNRLFSINKKIQILGYYVKQIYKLMKKPIKNYRILIISSVKSWILLVEKCCILVTESQILTFTIIYFFAKKIVNFVIYQNILDHVSALDIYNTNIFIIALIFDSILKFSNKLDMLRYKFTIYFFSKWVLINKL